MLRYLHILLACLALNASAQHKVFFGNLHSHTSYSDGSSVPEEAYKHARDVAHIDFLAITEHNHSKAGKVAKNHSLYNGTQSTSNIETAKRFNVDNQFVALYGQEFSTISAGNHANVLEINEVINTPNGEWDKLKTFLEHNKDSEHKDAILILNHPSIDGCPDNVEYGIDDFATFDEWRNFINQHARLISIVNGPSHDDKLPGKPAESEFKRYLNMGIHVAPTADQDNHRTNWGDAATTRTAIIAPSLTKAHLLEAIRQRHVYATQDKNLEIIATVNDKLMGEIFGENSGFGASAKDLDIRISLNDPDEEFVQYEIEVYQGEIGKGPADMQKRIHVEGDTTLSITGIKYSGGNRNEYLYLKIKQTNTDGEELDMAWTAPVWFEPNATNIAPATPAVAALSLTVDEVNEEATITNHGSAMINLKDWVLVSVIGNQRFKFVKDTKIQPGKTYKVISGEKAMVAPNSTNKILWDKKNIWNNSGDPGQLYDANGTLVAEHTVAEE